MLQHVFQAKIRHFCWKLGEHPTAISKKSQVAGWFAVDRRTFPALRSLGVRSVFETCAFGHQLEGNNVAVEVLCPMHLVNKTEESDLAWRSCSPSPQATREMDRGS